MWRYANSPYNITAFHELMTIVCFHRENGVGELYAYLPKHPANSRACLSPSTPAGSQARSIEHDDWGFSVGRGAFAFYSGRWISVEERVRIGTGRQDGSPALRIASLEFMLIGCGKNAGEVEVCINGKSVLEVKGLVFGTTEQGELEQQGPEQSRVHGMHFQTFFGGKWISPYCEGLSISQ